MKAEHSGSSIFKKVSDYVIPNWLSKNTAFASLSAYGPTYLLLTYKLQKKITTIYQRPPQDRERMYTRQQDECYYKMMKSDVPIQF